MVDKEVDDIQIENNEDDVYDYGDDEVDSGAPKVAASKGSKMALIAFSAVLISVVLYFMFFSGGQQQNAQNLAPVSRAEFTNTTPPAPEIDLGNFDDVFGKDEDDVAEDVILETPDVPAVPELPDIFTEDQSPVLPAFLDLPGEKKPQLPQVPALPNAIPSSPSNTGNARQNNSGNVPNFVEQAKDTIAPAPIIVVAGEPGPTNSVGFEENIINLNEDPIDSLTEREPQITAQLIKDKTTTLVQGKVLTAILETAIHTEFPGDVRAIVSRDVYAESSKNILIPKGSRVYGTYSSAVSRGQGRVNINWTRLIRPDGVDATISFVASDQFGRAGIAGDVDNKYREIISNSILTSVLAIGGALIAEQLSDDATVTDTTDSATGTTTTTGSASAQAIADVSQSIVDTVGTAINGNLNLSPVIRVPQGTKITILVNSDMSLPQFKK